MTPGAQLATIAELYDICVSANQPADQVVHAYCRERRFIGSKDRRFIVDTLYDIFRHKARLTWHAAQQGAVVPNGRTIALTYAALIGKVSFGEICDVCDGEAYHMPPLSADEREFYKAIQQQDLHPKNMPLAVQAECPPGLYHGLLNFYGEHFLPTCQGLQTQASIDLRVNPLKMPRDSALAQLKSERYEVEATPHSPYGLRIAQRFAVNEHALFRDGRLEVQDEGAQILSMCCGVRPGDWVVDFCAGAGGKTLLLGALMQNKGRIWACDNDERRLQNGKLRYRKAGLSLVEMVQLAHENDPWVKRHARKADIVLLDVPCTGTGTWRRNPLARWQQIGPSLGELVTVQQNILRSAARLVKPGGYLLYATCSLLPQENEQQIAEFLANDALGFTSAPLQNLWTRGGHDMPAKLDLSQAQLRLAPHQHGTDGFFVAALQRKI